MICPLKKTMSWCCSILSPPNTGVVCSRSTQPLQQFTPLAQEGMQVVWLWPNVDAGSDDVAKGIRVFRESQDATNMHFYRNFAPDDYARLLANTRCIIGNSSSGCVRGLFWAPLA